MIVEVNSLEDMCDLMCDNYVREPDNDVIESENDVDETWVFTFGCGQKHEGKYVRIKGTYEEAREKMVEKYGLAWAFQYSEEEWSEWEQRRPEYLTETLLEEL